MRWSAMAECNSRGRRAIAGADSVPGVSAAVRSKRTWIGSATLGSVESGISPANRTERGLASFTRAILGYIRRSPFIGEDRRCAFRPVDGERGGNEGVGTRWFARCEVPDVGVLPRRYPQLHTCDTPRRV